MRTDGGTRLRASPPRLALGLIGLSLVATAMGGELASSGGGIHFGRIQILLLIVGGYLIAAAALWSRFAGARSAAALLVLDTLLLCAVVELGAALILAILPARGRSAGERAAQPVWRASPYYRTRPWAKQLWSETRQLLTHEMYYPYIVWRKRELRGETINVDADGVRRTPGSSCEPGAYRVLTFGGSTMWGMGSPDSATIPAFMLQELRKQRTGDICVRNMGESGFIATQGVIQLVRMLQEGERPDLVIFFDGVNDVITSLQSGRAGIHWDLERIAALFEGREPRGSGMRRTLESLSTYTLLTRLVPRAATDSASLAARPWPAGLDSQVVDVYLGTYRVVDALAARFGFEYGLFWQPTILVGSKVRSPDEAGMRPALDPRIPPPSYVNAVYQRVERAAPSYRNLHSLARLFDTTAATMYIDWHHLTPEANRMVAGAMLEALEAARRESAAR